LQRWRRLNCCGGSAPVPETRHAGRWSTAWRSWRRSWAIRRRSAESATSILSFFLHMKNGDSRCWTAQALRSRFESYFIRSVDHAKVGRILRVASPSRAARHSVRRQSRRRRSA